MFDVVDVILRAVARIIGLGSFVQVMAFFTGSWSVLTTWFGENIPKTLLGLAFFVLLCWRYDVERGRKKGQFQRQRDHGTELGERQAMTAEPTTILIIAAAAAILYPIGMLALDAIAQPMRLRMADTGRRVLNDPDISSERKKFIHALLDDAYDWKPMVFFVVTIPFVAFRSIWMVRQKSSADAVAAHAETAGSPSEANLYRDIASTNHASRDVRTLVVRYILSTSAANPIAALFVWIELLVIALIVAMTQGVGSVTDRLHEMVRLAEEPVMRL